MYIYSIKSALCESLYNMKSILCESKFTQNPHYPNHDSHSVDMGDNIIRSMRESIKFFQKPHYCEDKATLCESALCEDLLYLQPYNNYLRGIDFSRPVEYRQEIK